MKRLSCLSIVALALGGAVFSTQAQEKGKTDEEVQRALSKIVQLGPGVHAIKKDNKGRIQSCVIVGQARISTVLGKAKGLEVARDKARLAASAEFVKWLKEKVSVHQKSEEETILFLEGSQDNDKETLKESGRSVEKTGKKIEAVADGLIRGMQILHVETTEKDMTYSVVLGWSAANAKAVEKIEKGSSGTKNDGDKKPDPLAKPIDKKIEDKKATSEDAKKYLP